MIQPKRDPSRHPVFQINFIYQRDFVRPLQVSGLTLTAIPSMSPGAIYDLNFFMVERADGWRASCEYNTDLYEPATINAAAGPVPVPAGRHRGRPSRAHLRDPMLTADDRESWMPAAGAAIRRATVPRAAPAAGRSELFVAPSNETEARLAKLWEQVLGMKEISITADFFDQGGHSLLAASLLAQTERTFGRNGVAGHVPSVADDPGIGEVPS